MSFQPKRCLLAKRHTAVCTMNFFRDLPVSFVFYSSLLAAKSVGMQWLPLCRSYIS